MTRYLLITVAVVLSGCATSRSTAPLTAPSNAAVASSSTSTLRVMTYNIHMGREGLGNVAKVIRDANPDVVGLQEVDRFTTRLGRKDVDQLAQLSAETGLPYSAFFKASDAYGGDFGVAILSRYPIAEAAQKGLPTENAERRTAGRALVKAPGGDVMVYVTHLTNLPTRSKLRGQQARHILAWMAEDSRPKMLMGDFNDSADSTPVRAFKTKLTEAFGRAGRGPSYTFPFTFLPNARLDYVFASSELNPTDVHVVQAKGASDHYPIVADFQQARAVATSDDSAPSAGQAASR